MNNAIILSRMQALSQDPTVHTIWGKRQADQWPAQLSLVNGRTFSQDLTPNELDQMMRWYDNHGWVVTVYHTERFEGFRARRMTEAEQAEIARMWEASNPADDYGLEARC